MQTRQLDALLAFCRFIGCLQQRAGHEPAQRVLPNLLKAIDYETHLYDHEERRVAQTRWGNVCEFAEWLSKKGEEDGKTLIDLSQSIALINLLDKQNSDDAMFCGTITSIVSPSGAKAAKAPSASAKATGTSSRINEKAIAISAIALPAS